MPLDTPVLDLGNVGIPVSGFVALAPLGTALPTSLTATLNAAFRQVGYLDDDGMSEVHDESRGDMPLWQNRATLEFIESAKLYIEGKFAETGSVAVTKFWYGTTITQTAAHGSYQIRKGRTSGRMAGAFLEIFQSGEQRLVVTSDCEVFKNGDAERNAKSGTVYPFQIAVYDDPMVFDSRLKTAV